MLNNNPVNGTLINNPVIDHLKCNNLNTNGKILILTWSSEAIQQALNPSFGGATLLGFTLGETYLMSNNIDTQVSSSTSSEINKISPLAFNTNLGYKNFSEHSIYALTREDNLLSNSQKIKNFLLFLNKNKTLVKQEAILLKSLIIQYVFLK